MVKRHVWLLGLPIVESYGAEGTDNFHDHGILVSVLRVDQQLERVEQEHNAHEG